MTEALRPCLILCTTCRSGGTPLQGEEPAGAVLHAALQARLSEDGAALIELRAAACLANCDRGCSAAITTPGKWTYLLGFLEPALADDLLAYAKSYATSETGIVLPSRRPASLRNMIIGRIPDLERDDRRWDHRRSESREKTMTESGMSEREPSHPALESRS